MSKFSIIHGDSTKVEIYKKLNLGKGPTEMLADIVITDPPYCLLQRRRAKGDIRDPKFRERKTEDKLEVPRYENMQEYRQFTTTWLRVCLKHTKANAPLIIWSNFLGKRVIIDVCADMNYSLVGEYVWAKFSSPFDGPQGQEPLTIVKSEVLLRAYESALVFVPKENISTQKEVKLKNRSVNISSLPWSIIGNYHGTNDQLQPILHNHPCHKPFPVLHPLILNWTDDNDVIIDPFAGSGAIGHAVMQIGGGRIFKGIEIIQEWVKKANI